MFNSSETATGVILLHSTEFVRKSIMLPWVTCALTFGCMVFRDSKLLINCGKSFKPFDCHRFEQSVLGIVLTRIFGYMKQLVFSDFGSILQVRRHDLSDYIDRTDYNSKPSLKYRTYKKLNKPTLVN